MIVVGADGGVGVKCVGISFNGNGIVGDGYERANFFEFSGEGGEAV